MKKKEWDPQVGDYVCDCRMKHVKIKSRDDDDIITEDGFHCSLAHCCEPIDHKWKHEDVVVMD